MNVKHKVQSETQIRKLDYSILQVLSNILDINDGWRKLACVLSRSTTKDETPYTSVEMERFNSIKPSPSLALLNDWGTRGSIGNFPTVGLILDKLINVELFRAADYLAVDVLGGSPPPRPENGIAALYPGIPDTVLFDLIKESNSLDRSPSEQTPTICRAIFESINSTYLTSQTALTRIPYRELFKATGGFNNDYKLGQGGFGAVYLGHVEINDQKYFVAVKRLNLGEEKQFHTELTAMAKFKHENLLEIFGFSYDNPNAKCLVCAYMSNGSLEERLAMKNGTKPLPWNVRLNIAIGTTRGLVELHTRFHPALVHRDIKSANILLDGSFKAKIGDFGIAHLGSNWQETTRQMTMHCYGTPVYMPPEALKGDITVKMDSYSFGVVLYELITGLPPYNMNRKEPNLIVYITQAEKHKKPLEWKDQHAGEWPDSVVEKLFEYATKCTDQKKNGRPLMLEILSELESLLGIQVPDSKRAISHIPYRELLKATNGFNSDCKLGEGGFGAVYFGQVQINNKQHDVAIKKLNVGEEEQFQVELKAMAKYEHENLLQILGCSRDNPEGKCLICAYMPNGSLEERLAMKNGTQPLPWDVRFNIAIGIARGLVELHTKYEPLVHRDIKSANILLDTNFTAKIGDFGIARLGSSCGETVRTSFCRGTPVYMDDEALQGSIKIEMDTYSFGVVLFELITGLPSYDKNRHEPSLISLIMDDEEKRKPIEWKDKHAGNWPDLLVEKLFECATKCLEERRIRRPKMEEVLTKLELMKN